MILGTLCFTLPGALLGQSGPGTPEARLQEIEKLIDTSAKQWEVSEDGKQWKPLPFRNSVKVPKFFLKTVLTGPDVFAGVRVKDTPLKLKLKLWGRGVTEVKVSVNGTPLEQAAFTMDGPPGSGAEVVEEFQVAPSIKPKQRYEVLLTVENKGFRPFRTEFWPPRKKPLPEKGMSFYINTAGVVYPQAEGLRQELSDWLMSMKTGNRLINPDLRRFTFTRKPYDIPDLRKTPKKQLEELNRGLKEAVFALEPSLLKKANGKAVQDAIAASYKKAEAVKAYAKEFKVYLIGNAHIDIAWLWRMAETVLVAKNTYKTVIQNMSEYPELHYAQSQALTYQWIEDRYPELFQEIKKAFKTGRWEVVGGMWVEPDCNLISGESWVRQILYGKKYFKEKFGIDVRLGWNVDSFGYNRNMPQFYKKSGIDMFVTQKIWWNDTTVFPHYIFWWEGIDGTRLLSYFPPEGYTSRVKLNSVGDNITKYEATTGYKKSLILYGIGDHGGGPNREILNRVRGYGKLEIAPEFIHSRSTDFIAGIEGDLGKDIPVWKDELYLEYHRGTYTTQGAVKKGNRLGESRLGAAEKWASIANLTPRPGIKKKDYPAQDLEKSWKLVLTNQFHDILPGSSIAPVYHDAPEDYKKAARLYGRVTGDSLDHIASRVDTRAILKGLDRKQTVLPLVVFNPLSWKRSDIVTVNVPAGKKFGKLVDASGKEVPLEAQWDDEHRHMVFRFIARDVPAMGYRGYMLVKGNGSKFVSLVGSGGRMENAFYRLEVNKETGNIKSLYSKKIQRELFQAGKEGNVLQIYEDQPENWDAWNIGYTGRMWELNRADSVKIVHQSPVRVVVEVKKSFLGLNKSRYSPTEEFPSSFFTQYITLYRALDRIDIRTEADWWEDHMFLKAAFPLVVKSDHAMYEIPFAAISRTTKSETLWEKARFEVPALRWADLSETGFGVSLLNDCKYGHDIHDGVMKISLLRAPTWPDPMADRGKHTFTYSLYAHQGAWNDGETVHRGAELNNPLTAVITKLHNGELPPEMGFFSVSGRGVILETIKKAETGKGFIFRLYESHGRTETVALDLLQAPTSVMEANLIEKSLKLLPIDGKSISLSFKPFEIKTLRVVFNK